MRGRLATARGVALCPEDRLRASIIEQLLCFHQADVIGLCAQHAVDVTRLSPALARVRNLGRLGLTHYDRGRVTVPDEGRLLSRIVASCFDAYSKPVTLASYAL